MNSLARFNAELPFAKVRGFDLEDQHDFLESHRHVVFSVPVFIDVEDFSYEPYC